MARIVWHKAALCAVATIFFCLGIFSCASARGAESARNGGADLDQGQNGPQEIFLPERFEELPKGQSAATFKTSKPKAALYINGDYHGLTPLKAAGLVPGTYAVQIKRKGCKTVNIAIQVKDGVSDFYYIEMEIDDAPVGEDSLQDQNAAPDSSQEFIQTQSQEAPEL